MSDFDIKELLAKLNEWSEEAVTQLKSKEVHLFGSLIHKNGEQFGSSSDIDLVVVMPELSDAVSRHRWLQGLLEHKEKLELLLLRLLKRLGDEPIASVVAITTPELELDIHKDGHRGFFTENRFRNLLTGSEHTGFSGAGSRSPDRFVAGALGYAQKIRNQFLAVSANGTPTLISYRGADPLPKPIMRAAAMAARAQDDALGPGAEHDVKEGLDVLFDYLYQNRNNNPALFRLQNLVSVLRGARGAGGAIEAFDQLLLAEIIYDLALGTVTGSGSATPHPVRNTHLVEPRSAPVNGDSQPAEGDQEPVPQKPVQDNKDEKILRSLPYPTSAAFFAARFAQAFPGVRKTTWFNEREDIAMRLEKLLEPPLIFEDSTPIWWWRFGNLQIERFERLDNGLFLMNYEELSISRIAAVPGATYKWHFVYVEVQAMPSTGLYLDSDEDRKQRIATSGYDSEEYGLYRDHHFLTRNEYDDGAAVIDGRIVDTAQESELRVRYTSPYNFLIASNSSPINNPDFDERLERRLNEALSGNASEIVEKLKEEVGRLKSKDRG